MSSNGRALTLSLPMLTTLTCGGCCRQITTGSWCAILCALAFGKEEAGGGFEFSQLLVDDAIGVFATWLGTSDFAAYFPTLPTFFIRPLVHLCISGELSRCRLAGLRC